MTRSQSPDGDHDYQHDCHVWRRRRHIDGLLAAVDHALALPLSAAELEAQRFADRLEAVGIDQVHTTLEVTHAL